MSDEQPGTGAGS